MTAEPERRRRLTLVSDRRRLGGRTMLELARQASRAGVDALQVREKDLGGRALLALAREAVVGAAGTAMRVLVNGRPDIAALAGAHGVHLPEDGLPPADVRRSFPGLVIGASCHSLEAARRAEASGADMVLLGPVFATPGKEHPLGLRALEEAVRRLGVPVHAIGGIEPGNAREVWATGVAGLAAIRALLDAPLEAAARAMRCEGEAAGC